MIYCHAVKKILYAIICCIVLTPLDLVFSQQLARETDGWFTFQPTNTLEPGVIGMADWLDAPAGKHGFVQIAGSGFEFEDGTPIKFWGTNHSYSACGPEKAEADHRAAWYAKMGINSVRLHKYTYSSSAFGDSTNSTRLTNAGWERLDYYMAKLRETGIYYGWSPIFGHRIVPGDSDRVAAYDELHENLRNDTRYFVNYAEDLGQLQIDLMVHMLEHKNPHTGLRYADDPALSFVELQNEDNIFWLSERRLKAAPTYKRILCEQFSDWLRDKYGSHEKLVEAWGEAGMDMFPEMMTGEHLDTRNIFPITWFPHFSPGMIDNSASPRRILDTARFLYETQLDYYRRYVQAIRDTGYKGPIVGSCWQAGSGVSHYYNLHTDYEVGIIDRHNYFGPRGHRMSIDEFSNKAMVNHAGSGLLSSGLMSVKGRPFVFSEWTGKMPYEWLVEGPAIIGVYGMGFQDWDGSYHFNADITGFSDGMEAKNVYNTNHLTQIGLFPALARMIYRNDITPGTLLPNRKVHIPSLIDGKIGFDERVKQNADIKELGGDVPIEALALGRLELEFTDEFENTELPDFSPLVQNRRVVSNTGELMWDYQDKGYFTVNTAGTQAVVGFAPDEPIELRDVELELDSPFAAVFLTSLEPGKSIASTESVLITAMARTRNTGMAYAHTDSSSRLTALGEPPLQVEPVRAVIKFNDKNIRVNALDHDGRLTDVSVPVSDGEFEIDGGVYKTVWYVIRKK